MYGVVYTIDIFLGQGKPQCNNTSMEKKLNKTHTHTGFMHVLPGTLVHVKTFWGPVQIQTELNYRRLLCMLPQIFQMNIHNGNYGSAPPRHGFVIPCLFVLFFPPKERQ